MLDHPLTALAVAASLLVYFWTSLQVGRARTRFGVAAPAMTGHPEFERRYRVQLNTLETLALYLPLAFLAPGVIGDAWAAAVAAIYPIGRIVYARAYYADPTRRGPGFGLSMLSILALLVVAIFGAVRTLLAS